MEPIPEHDRLQHVREAPRPARRLWRLLANIGGGLALGPLAVLSVIQLGGFATLGAGAATVLLGYSTSRNATTLSRNLDSALFAIAAGLGSTTLFLANSDETSSLRNLNLEQFLSVAYSMMGALGLFCIHACASAVPNARRPR